MLLPLELVQCVTLPESDRHRDGEQGKHADFQINFTQGDADTVLSFEWAKSWHQPLCVLPKGKQPEACVYEDLCGKYGKGRGFTFSIYHLSIDHLST